MRLSPYHPREPGPRTGTDSVPAGPDATESVPRPTHRRRWDAVTASLAIVLFLVMAGLGAYLQRDGPALRSPFPPLEAHWMPHAGPGTPLAVIVAVLVVGYGPRLASRLGPGALLWSAWAAAMAWTWSLALIDGWQRGIAGQLTAHGEYLTQLSRFDHLGPTLRTFTDHILLHSPHNWTIQIAGHPAGAELTFVGLDRIGLGGGVLGAVFVITAGASLVVAALVTLRVLTGEDRSRAAAPFLVLTPGAVWAGVSADGYFAAVAGWALALLAVAATRTSRRTAAVAGLGSGLLLGAAVYLSYGMVLLVIPAAVVLLCARSVRPVPYVIAGIGVVAAVFTAVGFDWWQAYELLRIRYFQGYGGIRPYSYWFFGDLATVVAAGGPASVAGVRRVLVAVPGGVRDRWRGHDGQAVSALLLPCGFLLAILAADLSGMSKAETERIWLPFTLWLPVTAAFLPRRDHRAWLAAQALVALLVNHLLLTAW